jgi:5'/3'-nucleotidase SurE
VGIQVPFSGTVGAATYSAKTAKIPAIAFSGKTGDPTAWNVPTPLHSKVYADLALNITTTVINSGAPYLPADTFLNVNFPAVTSTKCNNANQFKYVLTRINIGIFSQKDANWCGSTRLPQESEVMGSKNDCLVSISPADANDKTTAAAAAQEAVIAKLKPILSCLS